MNALKLMFDFAFKRSSPEIINDLDELSEAARTALEDKRYFSTILIWFIQIMMSIVIYTVAGFEYVLGFTIMCIRGIILFAVACIAEVLSLGIRK
ncbi:hypothetical protein MYO4S_00086 [Serratia phage 4S]|nr:hypothetical protein MYO4S_00086 [Serratia phage 4S]